MSKKVEFIGEGTTDIGKDEPNGEISGVVPILVHKLCGNPSSMCVVRKPYPFLEKGGLYRKAKLAKMRAFYDGSDGIVFVVDTEGDPPRKKKDELAKARDEKHQDFPMAIGVAHPCIEAWLLADARSLGCASDQVPNKPEELPAPKKDPKNNPKKALADCIRSRKLLSANEAWEIARSIDDLRVVEIACPLGFAPFATEIRDRILPIFIDSSDNAESSGSDT